MALGDNLIICWSLDEASGTRVDSIGGHNLTPVNTPGNTPGKVSTALRLVRASSQCLAANPLVQLFQQQYSLCFWFRLTSLPAGHMAVYAKAAQLAAGQYEFIGFVNFTNSRFTVYFGGGNGGVIEYAQTLTTGVWYFVSAIHDATTLSLQLDAGAIQTQVVGFGNIGSTPIVNIGATASNGNFLDGDVDAFMIWDGHALSTGERAQVYNNGNGLPCTLVSGGIPRPLFDTGRFV